jgi:predicted metal-dependent phosphoesterase TrpH
MDLSSGVADLHIHTTASDGTCSVEERVSQALDQNLEAIAITDQDTISTDIHSRVTSRKGVELIAGVEVRADVDGTKVELLGYYIDPGNEELLDILEQVRKHRRERNRRIIEQLHEVTCLNKSYQALRSDIDGILARPHIAEVLINEGIVSSISEAFEQYLATGGEAFIPMKRIPAADVINAIKGAGGVVSLAHPGRIRTDSPRDVIKNLTTAGLDAIEVAYPYDSSPSEGYSGVTVSDAVTFAREFDLLETGGSDCHGPVSGKYRIGEVRLNRTHLNTLRNQANNRRGL